MEFMPVFPSSCVTGSEFPSVMEHTTFCVVNVRVQDSVFVCVWIPHLRDPFSQSRIEMHVFCSTLYLFLIPRAKAMLIVRKDT